MSDFNRFSKYKKNGHDTSHEVELPLAPMAAVFTVILVFLIKSASLNASTLSPATDLVLPELTTADSVPDAIKVEISAKSILVADKVVVNLEEFAPVSARNPASAPATVFDSLRNAIEFERGERPSDSAKDAPSPLVIVADKKAPYLLLKQVMAAAAGAGFLALKLVVVNGGE